MYEIREIKIRSSILPNKRSVIESREVWIDNLKGFAILLVMWGHVQIADSTAKAWITSFHVQVFLVISGYLFANRGGDFAGFTNKIIQKIAHPYVIFSVIAIITDIFWAIFISKCPFEELLRITYIDTQKTVTLYGILALWYLPSYCIASILFMTNARYIRNYYIIGIISLFSLVLCVIISQYLVLLNETFSMRIMQPLYYLLCALFRPLACVAFIAVGYFINKSNLLSLKQPNKKILRFVIGMFFLLLSYALLPTTDKHNFSTLQFGNNPLKMMIGALLGAMGLFFLFTIFDFRIWFLHFFGVNSLILLITHMSLKLTSISNKITSFLVDNDSPFQGLFSLALLVIMEIPIIYLINSHFDFLIKKSPFRPQKKQS